MAKIENPVLAKFFEDGLAYISRNTRMENGQKVSPTMAITPRDPAWLAWRTYFAVHLGCEPAAVKMVLRRQIPSLTVPCELPENFDLSYVPPEHPVVFRDEVRTEPTPAERERTIALMEAWKRNRPPPIVPHESWNWLAMKGGNRLGSWQQAGQALRPYTRRGKQQEAVE